MVFDPSTPATKSPDDEVGSDPWGEKLPPKTFVQKNRLRIRSLLLLGIPSLILLSDRSLHGSATGFVLQALGSTMVLAAVVGRFWCYVYNSGARTKTVITHGPYSLCRNPIYLCSIGVATGVGLLSQSLVLALLFGASAFIFYMHIVDGEETKLTALHGNVYIRYLESTSRYLPRFDRLRPGTLERVPGDILMRKIPKLIALALVFPLTELCNRLHQLIGFSIWEIL